MTSPTVSSIRALAAELIARERWTRARLAEHQRQALASLVRHAATASPYYRERLARWSKGADVQLADLPVLTHATLMSAFDGIVCDPRVRLADLERHVASATPGALYLGGYRVFVTGSAARGDRGPVTSEAAHNPPAAAPRRGGTTASLVTHLRSTVFLYSRAEWTLVPANYVRWITALGLGLGTRLATIGPSNPLHLANRAFADLGTPEPSAMAATAAATPAAPGAAVAAGAKRPEEATALRLTVAMPIADMVTALNAYQPDIMVMPPSAASRLADEQAAGRLVIRPRTILSSAEVLTDASRARFRAAWGADLFDSYAMTETGLIGVECPQRGGIHISEDLVIVESVDEKHQPVPYGTAGAKVLVTNLTNYAQPLIRYEVPDRITLSPDICRCGRPFTTIARIDPRSEPGIDPRERRRALHRDHRADDRRQNPSGGDYSDTPTMALDDLPTVIGNVTRSAKILTLSKRRT